MSVVISLFFSSRIITNIFIFCLTSGHGLCHWVILFASYKSLQLFCLTSAQQFGEQMQQSNPEMFEQLRTQAQAAVNLHREQEDQSENDDSKPG